MMKSWAFTALAAAMKPGAVCITSGIIEGKEEIVADALVQSGLEILEVCSQGEWRSVTAKKPE